MAKVATKPAAKKSVEALKHDEAKRKPTAEYQSVLEKEQQAKWGFSAGLPRRP